MALDRDLSVAFATALQGAHGPSARAWEMTAATGVRGLRILQESGWVKELRLTDRHPGALPILMANARLHADRGALALAWDARTPAEGAPFDYVDLDPYGSPLPFLRSAVAAVRSGGVLAVTATDMMVLAGVLPGAAERRYGAKPLRGRLGPEGGLRILLGTIDRAAHDGGQAVEPLLAYVGSHHVRAIVRLLPRTGRSTDPVRTVDPKTFPGPRLPGVEPYGPLWMGPLFDPALVAGLRVPSSAARPRECSVLIERFRSESSADRPFAYEPNELARSLQLKEPPPLEPLLEALRSAGWSAGRSHVHPAAFRCTAPRAEVEERARALSPTSPRRPSG